MTGEPSWSSNQYRQAWKALKGAGIPVAELATLRQKILREWASKDLRSALIFWSDAETLRSSEVSNSIQKSFDGHEEEMLDWINAGDFGLDGTPLLFALTSRINDKNPSLMLKLLPKVPGDFQAAILQDLFGSQTYPGPAGASMDDRIAGIATLPDARLRSLAWEAVFKNMANHGEDRFHELLAREDIPADAHRGALEFFAEALAREQLPAKAMERFRKLTPANQGEMGPSLLAQAEKFSFAFPLAVTNAITMLAESDQWQLIAGKGPEAIDQFLKSSKPNTEALSRWALQLPARDETADTFKRAVAARFREDLAGGTEWARSLPEGWHRQQALAQLATSVNTNR